jgi:hypothetical protein
MSISTVEIRAYSGPDLVELQGVNRPAIVRLNVGPKGDDGTSATVSVGTTTTGNAGTNASVTNSGTSSAAVFNFTIPRGDTGAAGPNSVTSATSSDGTATLSLSTLTVGSAATFNNTSWTYGTGAAAAHKTALAIASADITDAVTEGRIANADKLLKLNASGGFTFITGTTETSISSSGIGIDTPASNTTLAASGLTTDGNVSCVDVTAGGNIICTSPTSRIRGGSYEIFDAAARTLTLSTTLTTNRAIAFPDASGTVALTSNIPTLGANVATFLATPTSANLAAAVTDETGGGSLVFATSPTLTTPAISGIMALSYSNNAFANGLTVRNTSTGTNSLSGITVQDSGGTNVGYMQYCPSNFVNVGLQNTVIFGSIGTQRVGFVANAGGNVGQDVYFKNHSQQTSATIFCQGSTFNVGIGTDTPNAKALLDVASTTKGFLPPRMTTAQRDAITSVPAGLMIYNTSTNKLNFYNGSAWEAVTSA